MLIKRRDYLYDSNIKKNLYQFYLPDDYICIVGENLMKMGEPIDNWMSKTKRIRAGLFKQLGFCAESDCPKELTSRPKSTRPPRPDVISDFTNQFLDSIDD